MDYDSFESKFQYPIYEDRVYTVDLGLVKHKVSGATLIKAYRTYLADSIPPDIQTDDEDNRLF